MPAISGSRVMDFGRPLWLVLGVRVLTLSSRALSQVLVPAISGPRVVDFGRPLGRVTAWLYNLPEVASTHQNLRVPSVSARFATAPVFWNWCRPAPSAAWQHG